MALGAKLGLILLGCVSVAPLSGLPGEVGSPREIAAVVAVETAKMESLQSGFTTCSPLVVSSVFWKTRSVDRSTGYGLFGVEIHQTDGRILKENGRLALASTRVMTGPGNSDHRHHIGGRPECNQGLG